MKRSLLILITLLFAATVYAQVPAQNGQRSQSLPPPLPSRQVSGIVKDSTDTTLPGAVVKLTSPHDTLSTATNADGIFIFKNVKSATFVLSVSSLGYRPQVKRLLNNDAVPRLTLDPIVLKSEAQQLKEVVINGTPSITYKVDTIEYRASDYKVRPNATLDELLKKMEGFEVGSDGSVTHQGQAITKVKLNGKDYAGGDVAQAVQNLPAEIIEKAQVVDDYGDAAAHSGIKDGDPQKILNVTTKADRSVGTTGRLIGQAGNNDRYNGNLFLQRINGNQQIGVIANFRNTVTGVQSTGLASSANGGGGGGNSNPGTTQSFAPSINYRDQLNKKIQINSSATYGFTKNNSVSESYGTNSSTVVKSSDFTNNGTSQRNSFRRGASFELDYDIDSLNYLQVQPSYSYSTSENETTSSRNASTHYKDGSYEHQVVNGTTSNKTPTTTYGALALFNHRFRKPGRNFSTQLSYNHTDSKSNGTNQSHTINYADSTFNNLQQDLFANLITIKNNTTNTFRGSMTYSEPLGGLSRLELNAQMTRNSHSTDNVTDSIQAAGTKETDLIFNYNTTETRMALNYRYNGTKVNMSLGTTLMPYHLDGTKLDNNSQSFVPTEISIFRVLPIFRFSYAWSRTQRLNIFYTGTNEEPQFQQIQPFIDNTDPNNIVVGNPKLKAGLNNQVTIQYNNYFPNSRFNISLNGNANYYTDDITTNTVTQLVPIPGSPTGSKRSIRYINYVNISGSKGLGGNYVISKQLADRRYNLNLIGRVNYGYTMAMSQGVLYHQTSWNFNERFGPRITPTDNVEFNPFFGTSLSRGFNSADGSSSKAVTNSFGLDGRFYFFKTYQVHYDASKQFINQTISPNVSNVPQSKATPLVIDAGFQKEFGARRQFTLTFDVFDLLHQNNYITQSATVTGVTNTVSSSLSRYFLVGFRLNLQKWSGRPTRNGRNLQRRGDGSFIYN
ncbi:outer membrane beta-barrel protein [Mucilaginibacter boryungensis]|uniref:TonB-dependent receptor n=1 Tax=Mucilaginibacter boryungensis TaxID=768480 RepID=A0ABR9XJK9_9SPHI|nr:outer membrane beta-barrel protein [Mucilaginibacter boryungensis]MBE9667562.1 TonB-dependent receptor [Mucilaginibacter boryungensis]